MVLIYGIAFGACGTDRDRTDHECIIAGVGTHASHEEYAGVGRLLEGRKPMLHSCSAEHPNYIYIRESSNDRAML